MSATQNINRSLTHMESGAIFVELVFTLPLLLLLVWFFIYIGIIYNAKTSLVSAMDNSVRTAMTRGYLSNVIEYSYLYNKLDTLCNYQYDNEIAEVLFSKTGLSNSERAEFYAEYDKTTEHWRGWTDLVMQAEKFCNQPRHNLYAIIFTQIAMKKSIGSSIRFPCDPANTDEEKGGPGCMRCFPLNPCKMNRTEVNPELETPPTIEVCDPNIVDHRVALECEFRPASMFTQPIDELLKILTGTGIDSRMTTVSHQAYFDIPMDYDWNTGL